MKEQGCGERRQFKGEKRKGAGEMGGHENKRWKERKAMKRWRLGDTEKARLKGCMRDSMMSGRLCGSEMDNLEFLI